MRRASRTTRLLALIPLVIAVIAACAWIGPTWLSIRDLAGLSPIAQLRITRTLLAATAGAGLAVGGVAFQAIFRNPLATPYTLGIDTGAALGAAIGFLLKLGGTWAGVPSLTLLAFVGAGVAMLAVYSLSRLRVGNDMTRLLLAGVCVAYLCTAGIFIATTLASRAFADDLMIWVMGSLGSFRRQAIFEIAGALAATLAVLTYFNRDLDLLAMGDDLAATRGVAVKRIVWTCYGLVGVLTATIVANCGPIGFVSLMVPHMARALVGATALPLLISSAMLGAAFLSVCDALTRSAFPVFELPVGALTNLLGAAFFFYLLATRDVAYGERR
ncbi:MAG: iron ABC transporter permease [Phycisphaerae bacterium]